MVSDTVFCSSWLPICCVRIHVLLMLFVFCYVYWCPYHMMFVSFNNENRWVQLVEQKLLSFPEHPGSMCCVRIAQSLVLVSLSFFVWSMYCLSFDLRLLIRPLVFSKLSSTRTCIWVWDKSKHRKQSKTWTLLTNLEQRKLIRKHSTHETNKIDNQRGFLHFNHKFKYYKG